MTKLTLSVNEEVSKQAKELAKERGTSVSAMFSDYVRTQRQPNHRPIRPGRLALRASGLVKFPEDETDREVLTEALMEKYGLAE